MPLGEFSRLVGDGSRRDGLEIRVPIAEQSFVFVSLEEAANAFRRAFGIEQLFVDPNVDDDVLVYRPKATSTVGKRVRAEDETRRAELRAAYDARIFAVGWLAFVAKPTARLLASVAHPTESARGRTLIPNGAGSPPPGFSARATKADLLVASDADDPWSVSREACDRLEAWLF